MEKTKKAWFRFHAQLTDFLRPGKTDAPVLYPFSGKPTVKDAMEAMGVPHVEVKTIWANHQIAPMEYHLRDKDKIEVFPFPVHESMPTPGRPPRFILDVHLGKLARYLRQLGFDTFYRNNLADAEIVEKAKQQSRVILTRDKGILKYNKTRYAYWIRNSNPRQQLKEVIQQYKLIKEIKLFSRCTECNGVIKAVEKNKILGKLPPGTRKYYDAFYQCAGCGKIYWKGSHYQDMKKFAEQMMSPV